MENVASAGSENNYGEEGGKGAMEYTRTHLANSSSGFENSLFAFGGRGAIDVCGRRVDCEEGVADVGAVVHWEADRYSDVDDGYTVEGDAPEVQQWKQEHIHKSNLQ